MQKDDAKYSFAYKVKAGGGRGGYGGGSDSDEAGGKTTGKYFVQLPDGRLQTVDYVVDGDSGYVAKVSYSNSKSGYWSWSFPHQKKSSLNIS